MVARVQNSIGQLFVQLREDSARVVVHKLKRWPVRGLVGGHSATNRVNAEGKQPIKFRMKTLQPEDVFVEQIPVKRLQVPQIKDEAVTLRNRPLVHRVRADQVEESFTPPTGREKSLQQWMADGDIPLSGGHPGLLGYRSDYWSDETAKTTMGA